MIGIGKVLVPVDFSEPSRKAVQYGISLAVEANAQLILAHVVPFAPAVPYAHPFEDRRVTDGEREELLGKLADLVRGDFAGAVETSLEVRSGDIKDEILGIAEEQDVDLIVMGTHGRRRFERWLLGSVTEGIVRRSRTPVLTVSHLDSQHAISEPQPIPLRKILCATDLSTGSVEAIQRSMDWSRQFSAELVILHALPDVQWAYGAETVPFNVDIDQDALRQGVTKRLHDIVPEEIRQDPRVRTEVRDGVPYEAILAAAEEEDVDLIVLNTSSRPGLDRALLGSTAERVLRAAHVPVLSFPPPGAEPGAEPSRPKKKQRTSGATLI